MSSDLDSTPTSRSGSGWAGLLVWALVSVVVLAYASLFRPLWIDEYAHFGLGGLQPIEALEAIIATTGPSLNQGHTGVYLLADYWLMQAFGANLIALRLPSILSGVLLLASAVTFLRLKGFSRTWQVVAITAFAAQGSLLYYVGEARPYMPLTASCIATLAYYQYPLHARRTAGARTLGILGIVGGAVSHPYFALFGLVLAAFSVWERGFLGQPWRRVAAFLNLRLVLIAMYLYVLVGILTWAKGRPNNPNDPWYWIGSPGQAWESFVHAHTEIFQPLAVPAALALGTLAVATAVIAWAAGWRAVAPPIVLIAIAVATSAVITYASIQGQYWIFVRQWVGGMGIVTLAWVWLLASGWQATSQSRRWGRIVIGSLVALIATAGIMQLFGQVVRQHEERQSWSTLVDGSAGPERLGPDATNDQWVDLGNRNVARGGPVWREVSEYYLRWRKEG